MKQGHGPDAVANYICRLLTSQDERVASAMWVKWTEWRYGKAREHVEHSRTQALAIQIISHAPRPGDPDEELAVPRREPEVVKPEKPN